MRPDSRPPALNWLCKMRTEKAFSLVTVLCSGLIGVMWIAASYAMLMPLMQQASAGKQSAMMRTLAEAAVDYVSQDISNCFAASLVSKYDDPDVGAPYNTFELNSSQLGIEDSGNKSVRLSVTVKNEFPASESDSAVYDFQTVPSLDTKKQWSMVNNQNVGWRTIEVRVGVGAASSSKAVYRALMRPDFGGIRYSGSGGGGSNYFPSAAAFSTTSMTVKSNSTISGDLVTNGSKYSTAPLGISGSDITINGNVSVNSLQQKSDDVVALGSADQKGSQPLIKGYVTTNGETSGFDSSSSPDQDMVAVQRPSGDTSTTPLIQPQQSVDQPSVAPAPSAPVGSTDLGSINLSGDAKLVIRDGPASIPSGQSLSNMTTGTAYIPPGDYKVSSMSVSDSASVEIPNGTLTQPASFYLDNVNGGNSAISIGGNGVSNNTSGNFQVWYNGTNAVNLTGTQATMAVFAPNAKVTVTGKSSPINFKGALLGNSVDVSNAKLTFENPIASTSTKNGSPMYEVTSENGKSLIKPHGLRKVLWQELTYVDYIKQGNAPF